MPGGPIPFPQPHERGRPPAPRGVRKRLRKKGKSLPHSVASMHTRSPRGPWAAGRLPASRNGGARPEAPPAPRPQIPSRRRAATPVTARCRGPARPLHRPSPRGRRAGPGPEREPDDAQPLRCRLPVGGSPGWGARADEAPRAFRVSNRARGRLSRSCMRSGCLTSRTAREGASPGGPSVRFRTETAGARRSPPGPERKRHLAP